MSVNQDPGSSCQTSPHPSLDDTQSLFESWVFVRLVVVVGFQIECCDVIHHLQTEAPPMWRCPVIRSYIVHFAYFLSMF